MPIEVDEITLPSCWASALVNGDYSGLDAEEGLMCLEAVERLAKDGWEVVDVVRDENGEGREPRFTWHYQLYCFDANCQGGSVLDYVIHRFWPLAT